MSGSDLYAAVITDLENEHKRWCDRRLRIMENESGENLTVQKALAEAFIDYLELLLHRYRAMAYTKRTG